MSRNEWIFCLAVAVMAVAFAAVSFEGLGGGPARNALSGNAGRPAAGEARNIDVDRFREMMREGALSDREALFYEAAGTRQETP